VLMVYDGCTCTVVRDGSISGIMVVPAVLERLSTAVELIPFDVGVTTCEAIMVGSALEVRGVRSAVVDCAAMETWETMTVELALEARVLMLAIETCAPVDAWGTMAVELVLNVGGFITSVEYMAVVETTPVASGAAKPNFDAPSSLESHCTLTPDSSPGSGSAKHCCPCGQAARVYLSSDPHCAKLPLIHATALELSAALQFEWTVRVSNMALKARAMTRFEFCDIGAAVFVAALKVVEVATTIEPVALNLAEVIVVAVAVAVVEVPRLYVAVAVWFD